MVNEPTCSIEDCGRRAIGRGWCSKHWQRWRKHGDPLAGGPSLYSTPEESFAARTRREGDCLVWTGSSAGGGYGCIIVNSRNMLAHRYAWEREHGPIPEGMVIDHTCWNKRCVDIKHLRLATQDQNMFNLDGPHAGRRVALPRGVYRARKRFAAQVTHQGHTYCLGNYSAPQEASAAAEAKRRELFAEFAGRG